jgi:phage-related protein
MPDRACSNHGEPADDKPLVLLSAQIKTPPVSRQARIEIGFLIRKLQQGVQLTMPDSRPMPSIGPRCHELRVKDAGRAWRVIYRIDPNAVLVAALFEKKTRKTPQHVTSEVRRLLRAYDAD